MKPTSALFAVALLSVSALAAAQNERASDRAQAIDLVHRSDVLLSAGKTDAFFKLFHPGFYSVDTEGHRLWFPEFKAAVLAGPGAMKDLKVVSEVKNVQLTDTELMVWVEQKSHFKGWLNGKSSPMISTKRFAYNLVRSMDGWVFRSAQQLMTDEPWSFKTTH